MPIEYRPAEPLSPSTSAAYGAAEVMQQNNSTLASLYENEARIRAQALAGAQDRFASQNAALGQQSAQAATQRAAQSNLGAEAYRREQVQTGLAGQQQQADAARFSAEAQQQANQNVQRAQLQAWLSEQEVGQAEQMRAQRMKNALDEIMSNPSLTAEEKQDYAFQIKTGLDPIQQRLKKQQAEAQAALTQKQLAAADLTHQQMLRQSKLDAMTFDERQAVAQDGSLWVQKKVGEWEQVKGTSGTERLDALRLNRGHLTADQYFKEYNAAAAEVDNRKKNGESEITSANRTEYVASALDARGIARSWPEQKARQDAEVAQFMANRPTRGGQAAAQAQPINTGAGGDFGAQPQQSSPTAIRPEAVKQTLDTYSEAADYFQGATRLSAEERTQGTVAAQQASELIRKSNGDLRSLSPDEQALYERARLHAIALAKLNKERGPKAKPKEERQPGFTSLKFQ